MSEIKNPLGEIISDEQFEQLQKKGVLDFIAIRNIGIRKEYFRLRELRINSNACIELLMDEYKSLAFETIRKIVMNK
ncbi:MAG: hypothetical protein M0P61_00235 [Ignavibacteriaceae bacterium]|jgi:hypothetical protein|nr:hypothetical protein [Ignavibacteriaceae bacterium]